MDDERIDCTVVFGSDNVNHLCGYWRYFGGPSALVIGRDGERTLVVMLDEAPVAEKLSAADRVLGFGERGFGIDLDPVAGLIEKLAAIPAVTRATRHRCRLDAGLPDARLGAAVPSASAEPDRRSTGSGSSRTGTSFEKINAGYQLCWLGQEAVADGASPA